ncbi:dimethylaniline monooxygenase [N-oxide-forming] 2 [Megalops cyprinoides]|uniref:dimethylaniline monooxygenase [N-oxide-forming] 2 n=1 Tax=Megalops cyprinoides TaxID=118141 RepID=UPI001863BD51|nr:dimethylaniline monooxygenase [N-oxide-forming] 2 [Megalops cyprinoides]
MAGLGKLRVAVVGAGAAGLCTARHLLSRGDTFAPPIVYELTKNVGGTWVYEERVGKYDNGLPIHSSMYRDLRTNIPKEVMSFPDFPFEEQLPSFVHHTEVRKYLEKYCDHFRLRDHIQFGTMVDSVRPVEVRKGWRGMAWDVTTSNGVDGSKTFTERFDAVMVCNGHFYDPYIPDIPGLEKFSGSLMHSHDYRSAEPFSGKSVVLLGAGLSGLDIAMELSAVNAKVILSHGLRPLTCPLPPGVQQARPVQKVLDDGTLQFQDGAQAKPEVFLFCTGYNFTFPFLDSRLGLRVQDHLVSPLYKFLMPPAYPSLFIVGICRAICPFPHFHCQTQFVLSVLDGSFSLPSREEMERDVEEDIAARRARGIATRHVLKLDSEQWAYNDELARLGCFAPLPPYWSNLYESNKVFRARDMLNYKTYRYTVLGDRDWVVHTQQGQAIQKPLP